MRAVVQRVTRASVTVDGETAGAIGPGLCVFLGAGPHDTVETARHLAGRIATLRVFPDAAGAMNVDIATAGGGVLVVSQFTLYADTSRGHRPSFIGAGPPELAARLVDEFRDALTARGLEVASGVFGAQMEVSIENTGPVTIVVSDGEPPWPASAG